jgi:mRNA interferase HigB
VRVIGQAVLTKFARRHAQARKPIARFLDLALAAEWKHLPDLRDTFASADYAPETGIVIFDIGGNKYRLVALVNFETQTLFIDKILTHEEYDRKDL